MRSDPLTARGFTLLELLVVIVLISVVTTIAIPAIRTSLYSDQLKASSRRLIGLVNEVSQDAVNSQTEYFLHFDLKKSQVWAVPVTGPSAAEQDGVGEEAKKQEKRLQLPESIKIVAVESSHGDKNDKNSLGETVLEFSKKGYVDKTAIHLRSSDGDDMTILLSPFLGVIRVFDSYIGLDDERARL